METEVPRPVTLLKSGVATSRTAHATGLSLIRYSPMKHAIRLSKDRGDFNGPFAQPESDAPVRSSLLAPRRET